MVLTGLTIPKSSVEGIPELLSAAGIEVEKQEFSDEDVQDKTLPGFNLVCSAPYGRSVEISFTRPKNEKLLSPENLVIVLREISPSWFKKNKLLSKIESILRENGATDLPPRPN